MTKYELNRLIAMYIIAIGPTGYPNSHTWMKVDPQMRDLDRHLAILGALKKANIIEERFDFLTLTLTGMDMHRKIADALLKPGSPGEQVSCYENCKPPADAGNSSPS